MTLLPDWEWEYCDNCGETLKYEDDFFIIPKLLIDIDSANAGESATLCEECYLDIRQRSKV